jgi:hypothetical protein
MNTSSPSRTIAPKLVKDAGQFLRTRPSYHEARRRFVFKGNPPPQRSRAPIQTAVEAINNSLEEVS